MRLSNVLLLLLLFSLLHPYYVDPPFSVFDDNIEVGHTLENYSFEEKQTTISDPIAYANMTLLMVNPSVDSRISTLEDNMLIWAWGWKADTVTQQGECNSCGCDTTTVAPNGNPTISSAITFEFKDDQKTVNTLESVVDIPLDLSGSENDTLRILLDGSMVFPYERTTVDWDRVCRTVGNATTCSCEDTTNTEYISITKTFSDDLEYTVEDGEPLFFLLKPILLEQWLRNNQFYLILFSNAKIYKATIVMDGGSIYEETLYEFGVTEDSFGLKYVTALNIVSDINETVLLSQPTPLDARNKSYWLTYQINTSDYQAVGEKQFEVSAYDHFGNVFSEDYSILHRAMSGYNNISEDKEYKRPSTEYVFYDQEPVVFSLGIVAVFMFFVLLLS